MVLQSISSEFLATAFSRPSSPLYTPFTWGEDGSMVIMTLASLATSAGLAAFEAPWATKESTTDELRSYTTNLVPFFIKFLAMWAPMLPRPMKPTGAPDEVADE